MITDKDGGPAYPEYREVMFDNGVTIDRATVPLGGMSKLMWLAAHAPGEPEELFAAGLEAIIEYRFKWATAMLAEERRLTEGE